jgi:hypothetical protein
MVEKPNTMSSRKYIHLRIHKFNFFYQLWLNGKPLKLVGEIESWMNVSKANKNLALAICKELYPGHENDLHEKFLKDYISKLKDSDIVEVSLGITEFCQYARDVIRIKQEAGVESIEDCLPF